MDIKLTQLPQAASSTPLDYLMIVQNGVNKKITLTTLLKTLDSTDNILLNPFRRPINIQISSSNSPSLFFLNGSSNFIGIDTATPQAKFHVNGNVKSGSTSTDGLFLNSEEDINFTLLTDAPQGAGYFKALNAARETSKVSVDTGLSVGQFNLGNGLVGQYKVLTAVNLPTGTKATIRVLAGLGFNRIDLTGIGQSVVLRCVSINDIPKWVCFGSHYSVLYTV